MTYTYGAFGKTLAAIIAEEQARQEVEAARRAAEIAEREAEEAAKEAEAAKREMEAIAREKIEFSSAEEAFEFHKKRADEFEARAYVLEHGMDAYNEYAARKEMERHNREMEAAAYEQARAISAGMANMAATMSAREEVNVASIFEDSRRERAKRDYKNAVIEANVRRSIGDNKFADYKEAQAKRYIADIL